MARDLKMQVILDAVDRVTRPLKKISQGSGKTAEALRASRDQLRHLERAQKDLRGFRELKRQSEGSARALEDQQREVRDLTRSIKNAEGPTRQLNRQRDAAIRKARALKEQYQGEQRKLQELRGTMTRVDGVTGKYGDQQRELTRRIREANGQLERQQQQLRETARRQKAATQAANRYHRATARAGRMAGAGSAGLATGGAALYGGARMLAPGVEYGKQMSAVQAVTRLEKDDPRFKMLQDQARDLGSSTAFSANQVGAGQEFLARANFSPEAIKSSMRDVLDLAMANRTELGRAADISSNISSAFKIDPEIEGNMRKVGDVLTATTTRANVDLEMLGETMKYLGAGSGLGLTMEQAASMAGLLGNIGVQGSQAGTTLRAMMTRLAAPTGKAKDAISALNLEVTNSEGDLRQIPEILSDIAKATDSMGNAQRAGYLKAIFGEEAGSGMAELIAQQGQAGVDKFVAILGNAAGENARVAKTMADNISGDLKGLNSAWEEVGITITDTNDGPLRDLIQNVTDITRAVGDWMKANPELTAQLTTAAAGVAGLVTVGGGLTLMLASILGPIALARYGMAMFGIKGGGLIRVLGSIAKNAIPTVIGALRMLGAAAMANPIIAIIAAIAAGALFIWQNWDWLGPKFQALWENMKEWPGKAWQEITGAFDEGIGGVTRLLANWSPIGIIWRGITEGLTAMGVEIPEKFIGLGNAIVDGLMAGIDAKFQALKDKVSSLTDGVSGWFKDALGINSPSRVFAGYGRNTLEGYQQGLEQREPHTLRQVGQFSQRLKRAGAGLAIGAASLPAVADVPIDTRAPLQGGSGGDVHITTGDIHVHASPGMDEQALARYVRNEVQRALAEASRDAGARLRSAMWDLD
ncbi:phage tail tape measure protein, TP901 family, core region [Onishia taeanensis]|uniref:Phage tail tape measure protein, TP901 family, core region n=1 Tax=Onishia taeanensis TaxID=284577 RepID=A0A1G7SHC3_9GAMM|nr:phage tail tape measure protein [Halomonas taeanensis]SDG22304.1 phage tail tape measure protein, TP901 family, core region [Halomonas taeanensis]